MKCNKVGERIRIDAPVIEISSEEFPVCQNYGQSSDLHYDTTSIKKNPLNHYTHNLKWETINVCAMLDHDEAAHNARKIFRHQKSFENK